MAEPRKPDIKKSILNRVRMLYILFFAVGMAIAGKILYIQYGPGGESLRSKGERISYERVAIEADRGDILAWDGRLLATSVPMYEVRMDFAAQGLADSVFRKYADSLAGALATFFGDKSKNAYLILLNRAYSNKSKNRFTQIAPRRVNHLEIKQISRFPILRLGQNRGGFIPVQINKRLLPNGPMASRTIGRVNEAGRKWGVEGAFDSVLRGTDGNMLMQRISGSFKIPVPDALSVAPVDGIDVVTTLDIDVQDVAENALRKQLELGDADWGTAVLMEVSTGEIRAITNLTRKGEGKFVEDFNYAVGMNLEPGSTFKLASLMTLLDDAGASLEEHYDTGDGRMMIGRARVVDSHACGDVTLREVFEHSSNVGFALAVNKYYKENPRRFVDHLYKMGLGMPLDLQIPGGADPVIFRPGDASWSGVTLTMMSYGYALRLTPLKTLSFYNAVANDGKMVRPMFVKELKQYGQTLRAFPPEVMVSSIGSPKVIAQVQEALRGVVNDGTARGLKNPYYSVAGKTGTAQIAMGRHGYTDRFGGRHYLATLVGYFPADKPRYSCIVAIKTYNGPGRRGTYYGASLAGPVFRAIADRVYARNTSWQTPLSERSDKADGVPALKSGRADEVRRVARRFDVPYTPERGVQWQCLAKADSTGMELAPLSGEPSGAVPQVVGMGIKEAIYLLEREGLRVAFSGTGYVRSQSIPAGTPAQRGALVVLQLGAGRPEVRSRAVKSDAPAEPER